MKILVVSKTFGVSGGTEKYILQLLTGFVARGHQVSLLYGQKRGKGDMSFDLLEKVLCAPVLNKYPSKDMIGKIDKVNEFIDEVKPDVVYLMDILNYELIERFVQNYPTVAIEHHPGLFCFRDSKSYFFSRKKCSDNIGIPCYLHGCFFGRKIPAKFLPLSSALIHVKKRIKVYRTVSHIICISNYMKNLFMANGFSESQLFLIPHYTDAPKESETEYPRNSSIVLYVGRVDRYKGVDFLIESILHVKKNIKVIIAGDGSWLNKMKLFAQVKGLGRRIKFLGRCKQEVLEKLYKEAAVVVVPSIWDEPFGLVGIEAMAFARPVVAFDVGGISDWLENGETGFLVCCRDAKGFAEKINILLEDKDTALKMGKNGRKKVLTVFNKNRYFSQLEDFLASAIQLQ